MQAHVQSLGRSIGDAEECGVEALLAVQEKYLESGLDGLIYSECAKLPL